MIVYIPVDANKIEEYSEKGFDIGKDYNKKIGLTGLLIKCVSGFLNPEFIRGKFIAVRIDGDFAYIANYDLWLAFELTQNEHFNRMYISSITEFKKYRYGTFRIPEVLILKSIAKDNILDISDIQPLKDGISLKNDQIYLDCLIDKISQDPMAAKRVILDYFDRLCEGGSQITKKVVSKGESKLYIFIQKNEWAYTVEI